MKKKISLICASFMMVLCSCNSISGQWYDYTITEKIKPAESNDGSSPFNTIMRFRYFLHDENTDSVDNYISNEITQMYHDEIIRLHKIFDRHFYYYEDDSNTDLVVNVKTLNDSYSTNNAIKVSKELFDLIKQGIEFTKLTEGYFNILSGGLTDIWDELLSNYDGPEYLDIDPYYNENTREEIENAKLAIPSYTEIDEVLVLDEENLTIQFNKYNDNLQSRPYITVGGIAKGYATALCKDLINGAGFENGVLYSGGSSITSLGTPIYTNNIGQKINIVDPNNSNTFENKFAYSFALKEEFDISTSGNYTQGKSYWFIPSESNNPIYRHHIINPYTGYPENYYRSVTVISNSLNASIVDVLSTALENLDLDKGQELIDKVLQYYPNSDLEVIYLMQQGSQYEDYQLLVHSTSDIGGTLKLEEGVKIYEA